MFLQAPVVPLGAEGAEPEQEAVEADPQADPLEHYWARANGADLISELQKKESAFYSAAQRRGLFAMYRLAYAQHYGLNPQTLGAFETQQVSPDGERGELLMFRVNETRSYTRQQISIAVGNRPSFKSVATNTDYRTLSQIESTDALVNSLYRADMSEQKEHAVVESDSLFGAGYGWIRWDGDAGDEIEVPTGEVQPVQLPDGTVVDRPVTERRASGMPSGRPLYPWELILDPTRSDEHEWCIVHEPVSRWELIARWPEHADELKAAKLARGAMVEGLFGWDSGVISDDDLFVRHFYRERSAAMPEGRYVGYVGTTVLWDLPCPVTKGLPIVPMCTARFVKSCFGYADHWDLLSIQQAIDQIMSDALTSVSSAARPSLVMDKGTALDAQALADGQRMLVKDRDAALPQYLNHPGMAPGTDWMLGTLLARLGSISGLNAAARGDAEGVKSGQHAALLHSIAIEFQNLRQAALDQFRERYANLQMDMVRLNAEHAVIVEVVGDSERVYARELTRDAAFAVRRVYVETANPMLRSQAGRLEIFSVLKDLPPAQKRDAVMLLTTGQIRTSTREDIAADLRVRWENDRLRDGHDCQVLRDMDDDVQHLRSHRAEVQALMCDPESNRAGIEAFLRHIRKHVDALYKGDAVTRAVMGLPPPPPKAQPGGPMPAPAPGGPGGGRRHPAGAQRPQGGPPSPPAPDDMAKAAPPARKPRGLPAAGVDSSGVRLPGNPEPPPGSNLQTRPTT